MSIAGDCSGHGYKFVPLVGEVLADLAGTGATPHPNVLFHLARFA